MAFNSFEFWVAFPAIFALYWLIPSQHIKAKKWYLIVVSYLLYINWKPSFALVLLGVTIITYLGAIAIEKQVYKKRKKTLIYCFAILGLLPLLIFKYYNFLNDSLTAMLDSMGMHFSLPGLNWAIPVGISFFTFQAIGYLFDVYYKRIEVEKSFSDYTLFVSFFPQISSGPISKASELLPQIKSPRPFAYEQGIQGLKFLLWGMFIKLVIADRLGLYVDIVYGNYIHYSGLNCLIASIFYSFQIYADFAGYSLMAMGVSKTLGYNIINNFRQPYLSISVTDFWRRWHISLSRWLKDYVYIPLGGSCCSKRRNYFNIFITFLVSGIWHGASWSFILWGVLHGIFQIIEKALHLQNYQGNNYVIKFVRIIITFLIINFLWIFFRINEASDAIAYISHILTDFNHGEFLLVQRYPIMMALPLLWVKDLKDEFSPQNRIWRGCSPLRKMVYLYLFCMIILMGVLDSGQFIYVNF